MFRELKVGMKVRNIISNYEFTLNKTSNGMWFLRRQYGMAYNDGEACTEKEMVKLLNSRFEEVEG